LDTTIFFAGLPGGAEAVRAGAQSVTNSIVCVYRINEFGDLPSGAMEELDLADAIIYGSPTYMGGPAWQFKKFADSSAKAFLARKWKDKLLANHIFKIHKKPGGGFPFGAIVDLISVQQRCGKYGAIRDTAGYRVPDHRVNAARGNRDG
jgi:hypothetical protein